MPRRRKITATRNVTLTLILIIGVAGLYACNEIFNLDLPLTPAAPTALPRQTPGSAGAWYQLYFTDPAVTAKLDSPSGGIPDLIAASLDTAQKTIDVAVYEIDLPVIVDALVRAAERGVRVHLVTDTDTREEETQIMATLGKAGVLIVADQREAIMHDKFIVIDGSVLWTGSMNFTFNDAYRNNNHFMQITSTRLAQNYTTEFTEMFIRQEFGPTSKADTPNPGVTLDGTPIENYFAPEDEVAAKILPLLESAQTSIYFMAFSFTRADFSQALIERADTGVTVQGVFEKRQIAAGGDQAWKLLTKADLDVRQDGNPYNLHSKVFIIDGQTVVMGSYNFSASADEKNDENVLIIHNTTIAAAYYAEWQKIWAVAEQP